MVKLLPNWKKLLTTVIFIVAFWVLIMNMSLYHIVVMVFVILLSLVFVGLLLKSKLNRFIKSFLIFIYLPFVLNYFVGWFVYFLRNFPSIKNFNITTFSGAIFTILYICIISSITLLLIYLYNQKEYRDRKIEGLISMVIYYFLSLLWTIASAFIVAVFCFGMPL
jgi:hypothetical protein